MLTVAKCSWRSRAVGNPVAIGSLAVLMACVATPRDSAEPGSGGTGGPLAGGNGGFPGSYGGGGGRDGEIPDQLTGGSRDVRDDGSVRDSFAAAGGAGGAGDTGPVPMFVAIGKMSRTTVSCDDGRTWVANKSSDDNARCWMPGGPECDHHVGSGTGLAYGHGAFVANFGWGTEGKRMRTTNGVDWVPVPGATETLGGLAFGNGRFVGGSGRPPISTDGGLTWTAAPYIGISTIVRRMGFAADGIGRFIMLTDAGLLASTDGTNFVRPGGPTAACVKFASGVVSGPRATVAWGLDGDICTSVDNGQSWTAQKLPNGIKSLVFARGEFFAYNANRGYRSADGVTFSEFQVQPPNLNLEVASASPSGTIVAVHQSWGNYYDKQKFYRTTDGVSWTVLPNGAYTPSHPITQIVWGYGKASTLCPAP